MPKFSIIVPVYNVELFLRNCIKSILMQNYDDFEVILVDDGSTDTSYQICQEYAATDSRIILIHKENGGLSSARNAGLEVAKGELIYFLDSDDMICGDLLKYTASIMTNNIDMLVFGYQKIDEEDRPIGTGMQFAGKKIILNSNSKKIDFFANTFFNYRIGWEAWNRVYQGDIIRKYRIRFADNNKIFAEDIYFNLCYLSVSREINVVEKTFYLYRTRKNSIMSQQRGRDNTKRFFMLAQEVFLFYQKYVPDLVRYFPIIFYKIYSHALKYLSGNFLKYIYGMLKESSEASQFAMQQFSTIKSNHNIQKMLNLSAEERNIISYYKGGNYNILRIRNRITYFFEGIKCKTSKAKFYIKKSFPPGKKVFILDAPLYWNIGDLAILEAEYHFLKVLFYNLKIIDADDYSYNPYRSIIQHIVRPKDYLTMQGGGNMGNQWFPVELVRRNILDDFPQQKVLIFPQTIYYTDTETGRREREASISYYNNPRITLVARERPSYEEMKRLYPKANILLTPDIVLSLPMQRFEEERTGILLCLRSDAEKSLQKSEEAQLEQLARETGLPVERTDMVTEEPITAANRGEVVRKKLRSFASSKLVITDRLHGMIFAAITGTPCIVFSNYNHKVRGTYEWISYLPYIKFAEKAEDVAAFLPELLGMEDCTYDNTPLKPYFDQLAKSIREQ